MKDKWMNVGYDADELKPHIEPVEDYNDSERIGERSLFLPVQKRLFASADPDSDSFLFLVIVAVFMVQNRQYSLCYRVGGKPGFLKHFLMGKKCLKTHEQPQWAMSLGVHRQAVFPCSIM